MSNVDQRPVIDPEREYVLGTNSEEETRLGLQHRLWSGATQRLWERAGLRPGQHILDIGCGPGFAAMDLAQCVGPKGRVVGVETSAAFVERAEREARTRGVATFRAVQGDVQEMSTLLPDDRDSFDLAYARWVLCFLPRPEAVIAGTAQLLKRGGRIVIQDYFNYEHSIRLAPRRPAFDRIIEALAASWREHGGDPDIAGRLPGMLAEHGFRVLHLDSIQRVARPPAADGGDTMWHWPDSFFRNITPRLVTLGFLSQAECDAGLGAWEDACNDPDMYVLLPTVIELVAERVA